MVVFSSRTNLNPAGANDREYPVDHPTPPQLIGIAAQTISAPGRQLFFSTPISVRDCYRISVDAER